MTAQPGCLTPNDADETPDQPRLKSNQPSRVVSLLSNPLLCLQGRSKLSLLSPYCRPSIRDFRRTVCALAGRVLQCGGLDECSVGDSDACVER